MAYGTPESLDDVEMYYRDIRGGATPSPQAVASLTERYRRVGGKTPLLEITQRVAQRLETRLNQSSVDAWCVFAGMKHWHPYIGDALAAAAESELQDLVALPLAPHYSRFSIDGYAERVSSALDQLAAPLPTTFIQSWHANPRYIRLIAGRIADRLRQLGADADRVEIVFTAHSLPARVIELGDAYPDELESSASAIARAAGIPSWRLAYQSAGKTGERWLGPDILDCIESIANAGGKHVLVVPFGFVSDHLEILYDVDVEAAAKAESIGLHLARIEMPNDDPRFIDVLHDLIVNQTGARTTQLGAQPSQPM